MVGGDGSGLAAAVLLGAGASVPYLPVADVLKREVLRFALEIVGAEERLDELAIRANQPHVTLEVFCSMLYYRCGGRFRTDELWTALCAGVPVSPLVRAVAALRVAGVVGPILTTNFDQMVVDALTGYGQVADRDFRVVTEWQAEAVQPIERDVCALHGTIYEVGSGTYAPPLTTLARGLARPLTPGMHRYLTAALGGQRPVLVLGYSGQDHYDVSPVLHELRRAARLRQWLWVCHEDRPDERRRIGEILDTDQIVVADASAILSGLVAGMASSPAAWEPPMTDPSIPSWQERLRRALGRFRLPVEGVREFVRDVDENLPGAWVVQEHYRLFSAGFDERAALTFGGVTAPETVADLSEVAHLSFLSPPQEVPFGDLLTAQFTYRLEDEAHWAGGGAADELFYPRTTELLSNCLAKLQTAIEDADRRHLRPEDRALLLVGMAIAEDYLGLIDRKTALLSPGSAAVSRQRAVARFRMCTQYAEAAGELVRSLQGDHPETSASMTMTEDLIQYHVWAEIGRSNVARTVDREEAIDLLHGVIQRVGDQIVRERQRRDSLSGREDYLTAYYPQLWLRAAELVKVILKCDESSRSPCSWDTLTQREQRLCAEALAVCTEAYDNYSRLTVYPNSRYPARFEATILVRTAQLAATDWPAEGMAAARAEIRAALAELTDLARRFPTVRKVRAGWVERVANRASQALAAWPDRPTRHRS